nr:exosortase N [uncultured Dyadobacter sp.]
MFTDRHLGSILLIAYAGLATVFFIRGYLIGDATFWMGIMLIPVLVVSLPPRQRSLRLAPAVLMLLLICFCRQELSFRFLLLLTAILFVSESLFGKLNALLFLILLIISPLFKYASEVFTFPIRLEITEWAGTLLRATGLPVSIAGNSIWLHGAEFSVDPACMGLQMNGFALLSAIFLMIDRQRRDGKSLPFLWQFTILAAAFLLNVSANLARIVMLVQFAIAPGNPAHDWIGIICLMVYVFLPLVFLTRYIHWQFAGYQAPEPGTSSAFHPKPAVPHLMLFSACLYFSFQTPSMNIEKTRALAFEKVKEYEMNRLKNGITQFKNRNAVVYVKPIPAFYSTEHSPVTCWTGSGYHLSRISEKHIGGTIVYVGSLKKGSDELQTAWWFSDGRHTTISQLDWRWKSLSEKSHFSLVNVTAGNAAQLELQVKRWLPAI